MAKQPKSLITSGALQKDFYRFDLSIPFDLWTVQDPFAPGILHEDHEVILTDHSILVLAGWATGKESENQTYQIHPGGRFSARVFSLFFLDTPGMGASFSVVFAMFFLVHVLFWCLKCCHLQWLPNVTIF